MILCEGISQGSTITVGKVGPDQDRIILLQRGQVGRIVPNVVACYAVEPAEIVEFCFNVNKSRTILSAEQEDAFANLGVALLLSIAIVYLVMVATFNSLIQPLILMVSVPFAATGAVLMLVATDSPLDVPGLIGALMLVGVVVTNAIVLIDLINQYRREGMSLYDGIVEGGRHRLAPILMTAAATIAALVPMALGVTGGSAFISQPLALVVIGGLITSTFLTLLLVPVLYLLTERRIVDRDAAFTTEITYGTLRAMGVLDAVIAESSTRPLRQIDPEVLDALRLGAYQLAFAGVPAHAAVGETVEVAPRPARGLVNAVLRKVAALEPSWPDEATRLSYPDWIVDRLTADLGRRPTATEVT